MANRPDFDRYREIIPRFSEFLDTSVRPLPDCLWANRLKITPEQLERHFAAQQITVHPLDWSPVGYRLVDCPDPGRRFGYLAGLYDIQEEVSMLPVELLDLRAGHRVLDTCAAPGSKTAQIAVRLAAAGGGTVIANDRNFQRMAPLGRSLDRLGVANAALMTHDATNLPRDIGRFDRVLADVPCSCEGTTRKNPDAGPADSGDFSRLVTVQRAILKRALELCRADGRVVYSTCTYAPEENEAVVDSILDEFGDRWQLIPARIPGFAASPGLVQWRGRAFDDQLRRALRIYPHQRDTGGFFVAALEPVSQ